MLHFTNIGPADLYWLLARRLKLLGIPALSRLNQVKGACQIPNLTLSEVVVRLGI